MLHIYYQHVPISINFVHSLCKFKFRYYLKCKNELKIQLNYEYITKRINKLGKIRGKCWSETQIAHANPVRVTKLFSESSALKWDWRLIWIPCVWITRIGWMWIGYIFTRPYRTGVYQNLSIQSIQFITLDGDKHPKNHRSILAGTRAK